MKRDLFSYILAAFNLLFLTYIITVGYYNRLAWDDYAFLAHMRDYGFFSPFTFWYDHWQGRFGPQFFINSILSVYKIIPNLFFYTALMSSLFIFSIFQILKYYLPLSKPLLFNYSVLLFSAILLTTFEFNTFYLLNVSTMYFGGVLFALLGFTFILKPTNNFFHYCAISFCFLYVGSSSEHAGILACGILGSVLLFNVYRSDFNFKVFISHVNNKKIIVAFSFCCVALLIMILAPGNKVRMSGFEQITDPVKILEISADSSFYILQHIFYKTPYILALIPPFILLGSRLKGKVDIKRVNFFYLLLTSMIILGALIFLSNVPVAYAMGTVGPLRSYVFINFFMVILMLTLSLYIGYHYLIKPILVKTVPGIAIAILFSFVFYAFKSELPGIKKYNQTDKTRVALLNSYQEQKRTEAVALQPLYSFKYVTVTDMFRILTNTYDLPTDMTDMPVFVGDIGQVPDWRNNHLKVGLGLNFPIMLATNEELTKSEMDSIKLRAEIFYETSKFKFYVLNNYIYYQIHVPSYDRIPKYIFCRIQPIHKAFFKRSRRTYFSDFVIADGLIKYKGDVPGYENSIFLKREITELKIENIETGFYDVVSDSLAYSDGITIHFE